LIRQMSTEARKFIIDNHSLEHILNMEKEAYKSLSDIRIERV